MRICPDDQRSGSDSAGEHTNMIKDRAREVATFDRFKEYRKSMPRKSACVEVVME
jgi:hypothetical protein